MSDQYRRAGVDIAGADSLVESISGIARPSQRGHSIPLNIGSFAAAYRPTFQPGTRPVLLSCVDGVGTKILCAEACGDWSGIGQDVVAMCLNDLACHGARPLFFLDYLAVERLDVTIARNVIAGIARACEACGCALIGGETAELPGMLRKDGLDVAGFAVGVADESRLWRCDRVRNGDVILGCAATGLHSNGYSLVRTILANAGITLGQKHPAQLAESDTETWGDLILRPTRLYGPSLAKWIDRFAKTDEADPIRAAAHITGGGIPGNVARIVPAGLQATIKRRSWQRPKLFSWLKDNGSVDDREMYQVWNMGLGFVLIVNPEGANDVQRHLESEGEKVYYLGDIETRTGLDAVSLVD